MGLAALGTLETILDSSAFQVNDLMEIIWILLDVFNSFRFDSWLPLRDSNPDMLLQRQLSYH